MWLPEILIGHNRTATLTCSEVFFLYYSIAYALSLYYFKYRIWRDTYLIVALICFTIIGNDLTDYFYFSVHLFNLLHATLTEVSIGLPLVKPLLPCLVSSHLSSSTIYTIFILYFSLCLAIEMSFSFQSCPRPARTIRRRWRQSGSPARKHA